MGINTSSPEELQSHLKKKRNSEIFDELFSHLHGLTTLSDDQLWKKRIQRVKCIYDGDIDKIEKGVADGQRLVVFDSLPHLVQLIFSKEYVSEKCIELALDISILYGFNVNTDIDYNYSSYPYRLLSDLVVEKHQKYKPYYLQSQMHPSVLFHYKRINDVTICDYLSIKVLNTPNIYAESLLVRLYRDMGTYRYQEDNLVKLMYKLISKISPDGSGIIIPHFLQNEIKEAYKLCCHTIKELREKTDIYTVNKEYIIEILYKHILLYESFKSFLYKDLNYLGKDMTSIIYSYTSHAQQDKEI